MSYLEPRGGYTSSGDRTPDPDVPAPFAYGAPDEPAPDPYAAYRGLAPDEDPYAAYSRPVDPAEAGRPTSLEDADAATGAYPTTEPSWTAHTAATSTSQAEWETAQAEREAAAGPRGPGKRRADRSGRPVKSRAGRNLPAAIAVGLSLGLVILASLIVWKPAFLVVIVAAASVGIWETVRALKVTGANPPLIPLLAGGVLITGLAWYEGVDSLTLGLAVTILAAIVWRLADGWAQFRRDFTASVLIAVYVPFLLGFAVLLVEPDDGQWRVIATVIAVVLSDTGGYAAGVFFGKHAMAPTISPKKSWEGFGGSLVAAAVGSAVVFHFALDAHFYWGLVFGAGIAIVSVLGDLAESMLKRDLGIKDMSHLLPGHGGLMDRLDSILFAVPTAYLLLALLAPPR
jgi:phosphatidate cytidylyltransferase